MDIDRRAIRRASGLAAAALMAVTLGAIAPNSPGDALGPVVAVTPFELSGSSGDAKDPVLSGRGETAGVFDGEVRVNGWAMFDVNGPEAMTSGDGITVSGNGCASLQVQNEFDGVGFVRQQAPLVFYLVDRCRNINFREVYRIDANQFDFTDLAMSFNGRFAVIGVTEVETRDIIRVDTETGATVQMPYLPGEADSYADRGLDISDNGNIVVATVRRFAAAANTNQYDVYAWDVSSGTVSIVSRGDAAGGAAWPTVSGDGRYVAFAAAKPLVGGETGNGPWVYVTDRANGSIRRVSNPGDHAWGTSISRDGSQVAYALGPPTACKYDVLAFSDMEFGCPGIRVDVAYGPTPGFTAPFATETVSLAPNGAPAGGVHFSPSLSGNGRWVAWLSNNAAGLGITDTSVFGQNAFMRRRDPGLAIDPVNFGTIAANTTATAAATVRNTGRTSVSLDSITVTPGQFTIQGGGTCAGGALLPPGATCTVNVRYAAPNSTTTTNGSMTVAELGYDAISGVTRVVGASSLTPPPATTTLPPAATTTTTTPGRNTTTTSTTLPPGHVSLTADPNPVDFGQVAVGLGSPIQTVTITNIGDGSGQMLTELGGTNPEDFFVVDNGCNELVIAPGQSCTMQIMMIPLAGGQREASLILTAGGVSGDIAMFGDGHFAPLLLATPTAITSDGTTTIIGQGFPPNQTFDVHVDPTNVVMTVTSDGAGQFQFPLSAVPNLRLGNYVLRVDAVPDVFDLVQGQLVVVLGTFQPQGPGGPAFGNSIIVTRGG